MAVLLRGSGIIPFKRHVHPAERFYSIGRNFLLNKKYPVLNKKYPVMENRIIAGATIYNMNIKI